jgi:hypothetical protein
LPLANHKDASSQQKKKKKRRKEMLKWYLKGTVIFIVSPVHSDLKTSWEEESDAVCGGSEMY